MSIELHFFSRNGLAGTVQVIGVPAPDIGVYVYGTKLNQPGQPGMPDHAVALAGQRNGNGSLSLDFTALNPAPDQPVLIFGFGYRASPFYIDVIKTTCGPLPSFSARPSIIPRHKPEIVRR
jgi:hypothetical protein